MKKTSKYFKKLWYALTNKELPPKKLSTEEVYQLYRTEKDKSEGAIRRGVKIATPLESKLFHDWLDSSKGRMIEIMSTLEENDKQIIVKAEDRIILKKIIKNDKSNEILTKYLEVKKKSELPNMKGILFPNEYEYFLEFFNLNKELIVEYMVSTKSIPTKVIYKSVVNKPNDEIRRIIARDNLRDDIKLEQILREIENK